MTDGLLSGLVWLCVGYNIGQAYRREKRVDRYQLLTWSIFVAAAVVFTLRIEGLRLIIDRRFAGYPVALLGILLAIVMATTAYSISLKWLASHSPGVYVPRRVHTWLIASAPGVVLLLIGLMLAMWQGLSAFYGKWLMQGLVEGYGMLQAGLVFVPINRRLFQHERIFPMRIKHLAVLIFCATFAITGAITVLCIPALFLTGQPDPEPYRAPRGWITGLCLLVMLVPHRWLVPLLLPKRLACYARLVKLERQLSALIDLRREHLAWRYRVRPTYVEMAIYVTTINILDNYRRVDVANPVGCELYAQIETLLGQPMDYDQLVDALCRLTL